MATVLAFPSRTIQQVYLETDDLLTRIGEASKGWADHTDEEAAALDAMHDRLDALRMEARGIIARTIGLSEAQIEKVFA